ncbi:MAG: desulfoferrodoxin [bacterium]|nr:desulfoferrodoxin [bacterium]
MAKKLGIYKCEICGNIVEVLHSGSGTLYCCGMAIKAFEEKTEDPAVQKHVPFIEKVEGGIKVRVGQNAAHPMTDEHYIEWIEFVADGKAFRQFLKPGAPAEASFCCVEGAEISVREYCNLHGLWEN